MKIYRGNIVTCDSNNSVFKYLVEDGGIIEFVGNELPEKYKGFEVIELGEKALLPAFGDGHAHFSNWALFNSTFDVRDAKNINEIGLIIKDYAKKDKKASVLFGFGHSKHSIEEKRLITKDEIDSFYSDRPVFIVCYDGHSAVFNSKTAELFPEEIKQLRGYHEDKGHLFHEAFLRGTDFISGKVPVTSLIKYILKGVDTLIDRGIGMIHPVEGVGFPKDMDVDLVRFIAKGSPNEFRIYFQTMDVEKVLKRKMPRIGGCFATALDGCFGAQDAALLEPYSNDPNNKGILFYSDEQVIDFVKKAHKAGLQIQMHVIGDAAVAQAVNALEIAIKEYPRKDHRHTLIHACLIPDELYEKIAELGLGITLQPAFLISPLEPLEYLKEILGDRILKGSPLRKLLDLGINVSGGSDAPVTPPDPIEGIYAACNHYIPEQSVTIPEALRMFTYNVAYTTFDEDKLGSLETGKIANMVILNKNPLDLEPKDLRELKVEKLILGTQKNEYKTSPKGKSILKMLVDGIKGRKRKI